MNPEQFKAELERMGIQLDEQQMQQFQQYYRFLMIGNEKMNLTTITEEKDVYLKHFYDSITAYSYMDVENHPKICDVGAGAGFPSIPLKICFPSLKVTIVDSLKKRIGFLNELKEELQLEEIHFVHDRAETFGHRQEERGTYDIVIARAVARMNVLAELCLPLCKTQGFFVAMKGPQIQEEVTEAKAAINRIGGGTPSVHDFTLPNEESERSIVVIPKQQDSPKKYPRKPGTPMKQPITH